MKNIFLVCLISISASDFTSAQSIQGVDLGSGYSIMPTVNYVSSATIQLNAYSKDLYERGQTEELDGGYGYGI